MENYRNGNHNANHNANRRMAEAQQGTHHGQRGIAAVITDNVIAIDNKSVAMAYVPWQRWDEIYPLEKALECGTLFPELFKPFMGRR